MCGGGGGSSEAAPWSKSGSLEVLCCREGLELAIRNQCQEKKLIFNNGKKEKLVIIMDEQSPSTEVMRVVKEEFLKSDCESFSTIVGYQRPEPEMVEGSKNPEVEMSAIDLSCHSRLEQNKPGSGFGANLITTQTDERQENSQHRKKPNRRERREAKKLTADGLQGTSPHARAPEGKGPEVEHGHTSPTGNLPQIKGKIETEPICTKIGPRRVIRKISTPR